MSCSKVELWRCKICRAVIMKTAGCEMKEIQCPCSIRRGFRLPGTIYKLKEMKQ